jgi:2-C-methyl-D-erythritol 4-phosphate cytidylyltransferase
MRYAVIIPAAGAAERYQQAGAIRHKLDEDLGGKPVLQRTVEVFTKFDSDDFTLGTIIVAGPHDPAAFAEFKERHADRLSLLGARLVPGGKTHRWETVAAALPHVPDDCDLVAIHDAARPCLTYDVLERTLRGARRFGAAIPGLAVSDTLKRAEESSVEAESGDRAAAILGLAPSGPSTQRFSLGTVPRAGLVAVQTPQIFSRALLVRAYAAVKGAPTDDAEVVEALLAEGGTGGRVAIVEGDSRNIKITLPADLALARHIMGFREPEGRPVHKRF